MTEYNSGYMDRFFSTPAPKHDDAGMKEIELEDLLAFHTGEGHPFEVEMDEDALETIDAEGKIVSPGFMTSMPMKTHYTAMHITFSQRPVRSEWVLRQK